MKHLPLLLLLLILQNHRVHLNKIEKNQDCAWSCSEGLQCKPRAYSPLSAFHCRNQPVSSTVFNNVMLSTVLACEGKKCSLQLKIATSVNATGDIRGVSVCADSAGMIGHCQIYTFGHVGKGKATGKQVDVNFKCVPVRPGQLVFVTLKTIPNYCNARWTQRHLVPECSHEGIRDEISECITGKLAYTVDKSRNALTVKVTDAPEDTDYNLRLCRKRTVICAGEGAYRKINPQHLQSSIMLHYSKPLPCLCIEGWPARVDARRIQVCPFKNNLEELWSGITYDFNNEELIWEPQCPVKVSVSLCHADEGKSCEDIGNVFHSEGQKVIFSSVDPHPTLCTKFATEVGTWIKCPFVKGNFSVWTAKITSKDGQQWAEISTWVKASFSISVCEMKPSSQCKQIEGNKFQNLSVVFWFTPIHLSKPCLEASTEGNSLVKVKLFTWCVPNDMRKKRDKMKHTVFNLSKSACEVCVCIQVQRVDVRFSVPVLQCDLQCFSINDHPYSINSRYLLLFDATIMGKTADLAMVQKTITDTLHQEANWCRDPERSQDVEKILLPAVIFLTMILAAVLFGRMTIKDGDKRRTLWTKLTCLRMNQ